MAENYYQLGHTLKKIRENKHYTQQEVADSTMSRSNYTKLEHNEINPNIVKFFAILDYMDLDANEFSFILNDYSLTPKETVFYLFKEMEQRPTLSYLQNLIEASEALLEEREDHITRDILNIVLAYNALLEHKDIKKAKTFADKAWSRLKKLDKFYLSELYLLNRIIFLFDIETAISLVDMALKELENYYCFREAKQLRLSFLSNLSCLLIEYEMYSKAMEYIDILIAESKKEYDTIMLGAAIVRKGLCKSAEGQEDEPESDFNLAVEMFEMIDRHDLIEEIKTNPRIVSNPYGYIDF